MEGSEGEYAGFVVKSLSEEVSTTSSLGLVGDHCNRLVAGRVGGGGGEADELRRAGGMASEEVQGAACARQRKMKLVVGSDEL